MCVDCPLGGFHLTSDGRKGRGAIQKKTKRQRTVQVTVEYSNSLREEVRTSVSDKPSISHSA